MKNTMLWDFCVYFVFCNARTLNHMYNTTHTNYLDNGRSPNTVHVHFILSDSRKRGKEKKRSLLGLVKKNLSFQSHGSPLQPFSEYCGGMILDIHNRLHGLCPQGWSYPQDEALRSTTLLGAPCKTTERYPKDTMRSVMIRSIPWFV